MKNFEAYESKIKELRTNTALIKNNELVPCTSVSCGECKFYDKDSDCSAKMFEWLYEEYKEPIKLSRLEYELLKYFSEKYDYICKEEIVYFENKSNKEWVNLEDWGEDLFAWLNKGEFPIQNILDNCEVVEDEKI